MSVVKKEYQELAPKGASLKDVVVLAQAWKKALVLSADITGIQMFWSWTHQQSIWKLSCHDGLPI